MTLTRSQAAEQFALWLAEHQPQMFAALARRAGNVNPTLGSWGDIFSSIGSAVKSVGSVAAGAISSVAKLVSNPDTLKTVGELAGVVLTTQAQKDALKLQVAQLQYNQPPLPIASATAPNGQQVPVYAPAGQTPQTLTPSFVQQLLSEKNAPVTIPVLAGVAGLVIYLAMRR